MALFYQILLIVLPVFLVVGLGFGLKRTAIVDENFIQQLNRLVFYVALPALLFYKIGHADFRASFNVKLLLGLATTLSITFLGSYIYGVIRHYPKPKLGAFSQASSRGNLAFIGLAVAFNAYGEEGFAIAGVLLGVLIPLVNFLSVIVLLLSKRNPNKSISHAFGMYQIAFNPLIIASFSGILWSYYELPLPAVIDKALDMITGMSLPLALIAIGASFSPKKLRGDIRIVGLATITKIILQPLLGAIVLITLGVRGMDLGIGVILAGTPTAAAAYIMAKQLDADAELSASIIMLSTLFSLFTYTLALYLLSALKL